MRTMLMMVAMVLVCGCATSNELQFAPEPSAIILGANAGQLVRAVCIGWNRVDPDKWGGWSGNLSDCEFDATFAREMWESFGIASTQLLTEAATIENCKAALRWGLEGMTNGDMLIVWTSGHGGQGPDAMNEGSDRLGEYICAYDGKVLDNTIRQWLTLAPEGVHILWICDTCHSGTMFKDVPVKFRPEAIPAEFEGELILLAGCGEDGFSLSTGQGGMWSTALHDTGPQGQSPESWFKAAKQRVPEDQQVPVYAEYGVVGEDFRCGVIVE